MGVMEERDDRVEVAGALEGVIERLRHDVLAVLREYTVQRARDLEALKEQGRLVLEAYKEPARMMAEAKAIVLEEYANKVLDEALARGAFDEDLAKEFFRWRLAAQVLREGFSVKTNSVFSALFSKGQLPKELKQYRVINFEDGDEYGEKGSEQGEGQGEGGQGGGAGEVGEGGEGGEGGEVG